MRTIIALISIVMVSLPSLFAGLPDLQPAWFSQHWQGVPVSVVFMSALMLTFVLLAGICSAVSRNIRLSGAD